MDQSDLDLIIERSDINIKISDFQIPDIIEPNLDESVSENKNFKEKKINRSVESLFKEENDKCHQRHYSDPGQKRKSRNKIGKNKRMSKSFTEKGTRENVNENRRCSTPEYKNASESLIQPPSPVHQKVERNSTCPQKSVLTGLLFAQQTLCPIVSSDLLPVPIPAPLVVEDPPSSENASSSDEENTVRHNIDPVLLNGSSGSFGGGGGGGSVNVGCGVSVIGVTGGSGGRSAPSTPHCGPPTPYGHAHAHQNSTSPTPEATTYCPGQQVHSQPASPSYVTNHYSAAANNNINSQQHPPQNQQQQQQTVSRSPSHHFNRSTLKQLSSSEPAMTAQARSPEPPSPHGDQPGQPPINSSRARQKKFHKHFKVDKDEKVENYYSCALVGDILLQGHLYITKNYFAFYSNVFGYVTKLLIPLSIVKEINKEKTARIIPNAVGVFTTDDKHHTFGSLMSREATYQHMINTKRRWDLNEEILEADKLSELEVDVPIIEPATDTGESSSDGGNDFETGLGVKRRNPSVIIRKITPDDPSMEGVDVTKITMKPRDEDKLNTPLHAKYNVFLLVSTLLLILLFTSAGILLYRISRIQNKYPLSAQDTLMAPNGEIYNEILHWQSQLHSKSAGAVHNFLDTNLDQIAKVRKSLEALSTLLIPNNNPSNSQAQAPEHRSELPPEKNRRANSDYSSAHHS